MFVMLKIGIEYEADTPVIYHVVTEPELDPLHIQLQTLQSCSKSNNFLLLGYALPGINIDKLLHVGLTGYWHRFIKVLSLEDYSRATLKIWPAVLLHDSDFRCHGFLIILYTSIDALRESACKPFLIDWSVL